MLIVEKIQFTHEGTRISMPVEIGKSLIYRLAIYQIDAGGDEC